MNEPKRSIARSALRQYHAIYERQFKGDTDATAALVDLAEAISRANLTERQAMAISLVYDDDLTQAEAGRRMGVRQNTVAELLSIGERKIDEIYQRWEARERAEIK